MSIFDINEILEKLYQQNNTEELSDKHREKLEENLRRQSTNFRNYTY
jgi:hypothetical protein